MPAWSHLPREPDLVDDAGAGHRAVEHEPHLLSERDITRAPTWHLEEKAGRTTAEATRARTARETAAA